MTAFRTLVLAAAIVALPAWAQQPRTNQQQARSYVTSAFMTGAAPMIVSEDLKVTPLLRGRLGLSEESDARAVYFALARETAGKSFSVRLAKEDEIERVDAPRPQPGRQLFAIDVSDATFVLEYDLGRDVVTYIADASQPVAVASPVIAQPAPEPIAQPKTAPEMVATPRVQVIEPREPKFASPVSAPVPPPAPRTVAQSQAPRAESTGLRLQPTGPCVVKPVMSDQDMVNCGAMPR